MAKWKLFATATPVFLFFLLLGWVLGSLLGLQGADLWILRAGLTFLGACATALVYVFVKRRSGGRPAAAADPGAEEIDLAIAAARRRLSEARAGAKIGTSPVLLILGPQGSTKTTTVVNSGLEPELLAGAVHEGGDVAPTQSVNVWFAQQSLLVEAGGPVLGEPSRWARLIRHIQPSRLGAVLGRRAQAPRLAVVCFPCDTLLAQGGGQAAAAAQQLRARLAEASAALGIRLPVYVLFTKADRIPHFDDFVRVFGRDEAQEILGATLPVMPPPPAGTYNDVESRRLAGVFQAMGRALALKRLDVLPRETRDDARAAAYEFPREFRKISDAATRFLVELCRPSQLGISPFLRGFYFTGVRAVVVNDGAPAPAPAPGPAAAAMGATSVFDAAMVQEAIRQAKQAAAQAGGRRVPEWVFIRRLFRDVILADRVAMAVTGGGTRVDLLRRGLIGAAAGFFLIFSLGMIVSFTQNRGLVRSAQAAARGVEPLTARIAGDEVPSLDALTRLDALRAEAERLGEYQRDGRPWRLAWGLYTGRSVHEELRRLYFDRFDRLLWGGTRESLLAFLRGQPEAPDETSAYGQVYDALKAHLITTSHPGESTPEFLTPVLRPFWSSADAVEPELLELATRQFDFYAAELPFGNPYAQQPDDAVVTRTRAFLARFADFERFYQAMTAEASAANPAIQFHRLYPGTENVLRNEFVVPGAFTRQGWATVQEALANVDRLFARETWVVGERLVAPEDRQRLAQELRTRYREDYVRTWQQFLNSASVLRFSGLDDAAAKLARLSDNRSPLLLMLAVAAQHTGPAAVDSTVAAAFQPVHTVVPPDATDRYTTDANAGYMALLAALQSSLETAAGAAGPARAQALGQATDQAGQIKVEVRTIAQAFSIEGAAGVSGNEVQRLLQAPVQSAETVMAGAPSAEVNALGQSFCTPFRQLLAKYPFNPQSQVEATVDEVAAIFQPGASVLWTFYEDALQEILVPRGSGFAARPGAVPQPSPTFVTAFNRAAEFSRALFGERGTDAEVAFVLRPQPSSELPEISVVIDGQRQTFTRTVSAARTFTWQASRAREARITANVNGSETTLVQAQGTWAIFRLLQQAEWRSSGGGRYTLTWRIPGQNYTLSAELVFESGTPVFMRDYLNGITCVPQVAR